MGRPRECSHAERYQDGRCKICTRKRHLEYARHKRVRKLRIARGGPATLEEMLGEPAPKPPCDLV